MDHVSVGASGAVSASSGLARGPPSRDWTADDKASCISSIRAAEAPIVENCSFTPCTAPLRAFSSSSVRRMRGSFKIKARRVGSNLVISELTASTSPRPAFLTDRLMRVCTSASAGSDIDAQYFALFTKLCSLNCFQKEVSQCPPNSGVAHIPRFSLTWLLDIDYK